MVATSGSGAAFRVAGLTHNSSPISRHTASQELGLTEGTQDISYCVQPAAHHVVAVQHRLLAMSRSSWFTDHARIKQLRDPDYCVQRSKEWSDQRAFRLGASECGMALGQSSWGKPSDLMQAKLSPKAKQPTQAQQNGIHNEQRAVEAFLESKEAADLHIVNCQQAGLYVHPDEPWLCASPDRIVTLEDGGCVLLEVKCRHKDLGPNLPLDVEAQVCALLPLALHLHVRPHLSISVCLRRQNCRSP